MRIVRALAWACLSIGMAHAQYPAHVLIYTYDGPVEFDGPVIDFAYTDTAMLLTMRESGDGIYRNGFE